MSVSFEIIIHPVHHGKGLINVPVEVGAHVGGDGSCMTVFLSARQCAATSVIDRGVKGTGAARIAARVEMARWFRQFPLGVVLRAEILSPSEIFIHTPVKSGQVKGIDKALVAETDRDACAPERGGRHGGSRSCLFIDVYKCVYRWYKANIQLIRPDDTVFLPVIAPHPVRLHGADKSRGLINSLPDPSRVTEAEILAVMREIRRGYLEWAYHANDGNMKMSEYAASVLGKDQAKWGGSDIDKEVLKQSVMHPWLSDHLLK